MPEALNSCQAIIVDDSGDADGRAFLARLNKEFGFIFDVHQGPRKEFAVGTKKTIPETPAVGTAADDRAQSTA
jgi:hypothetical protein